MVATVVAADAADAALAAAFDLKHLDRAFLDDPYPTYRALREYDPVHRMPDGSYFLTRYDDLVDVYRDARTWSSDKRIDFKPNFGDSLLYEHHTTSLVFNDPPVHSRVRKLLAPAFSPRALKALQPRIETLVDRLLDAAAERGTIDMIDDFAAAIPVQLIGDLLGIPDTERRPLRGWSLAILGGLEPVLSKERFEAGTRAVGEFKDYLRDLIARRTRDNAYDEREILSTLIRASELSGGCDEGERLSELELLHNCIFLLNAGHETTTNLIGNNTYVHLCIGAANRDPSQFPDPDRLDIRRHPNRHLAFGLGIHTCAGNSLARMEAQVAIGKLVTRFKTIERVGDFVRGGRARFCGFLHYRVALGGES